MNEQLIQKGLKDWSRQENKVGEADVIGHCFLNLQEILIIRTILFLRILNTARFIS